MAPSVILYGYEQSTFTRKVEYALLLKGITYCRVNVSRVLPRPEVSEHLGVAYRRVPILAIDGDVYCDSSLIVMALERHFPSSANYGTIFPRTKVSGHVDSGLVKMFLWKAENVLNPLTISLLPWDELPESYVQDRASYFGRPVDRKSMIASRSENLVALSPYLQLLEEQLDDGRDWLLNTEQPGLADISFYSIFSWIQHLPVANGLITADVFPRVNAWLDCFKTFINRRKSQQASPKVLTGNQAAALIVSSSYESLDTIGFSARDSSLLGVRQNDIVSIVPTDTGVQHPTIGKLIALSSSEVVIEVTTSRGTIRCHFPRHNFSLEPAPDNCHSRFEY